MQDNKNKAEVKARAHTEGLSCQKAERTSDFKIMITHQVYLSLSSLMSFCFVCVSSPHLLRRNFYRNKHSKLGALPRLLADLSESVVYFPRQDFILWHICMYVENTMSLFMSLNFVWVYRILCLSAVFFALLCFVLLGIVIELYPSSSIKAPLGYFELHKTHWLKITIQLFSCRWKTTHYS